MNHNIYLTLYAKYNSKCTTELSGKCKTVKLLQESIRENLCDRGYGNKFLNTTAQALSMKGKN